MGINRVVFTKRGGERTNVPEICSRAKEIVSSAMVVSLQRYLQ